MCTGLDLRGTAAVFYFRFDRSISFCVSVNATRRFDLDLDLMNLNPWSDQESRFTSESASQKLEELHALFMEQSSRYIGFPNSRILTFEDLGDFLKFNINNIGDPYYPNAGINTCALEQEVIAFWSERLHLNPELAWGYVTGGSTEAIMYGIAQGRDRLNDPVLLYSEECHYCLPKIAHLLRLPTQVLPSLADGSLNLEALSDVIVSLNGRPFILNLTVGTTFHGAIESPRDVLEVLERQQCRDFHLHVDAALYGPMLTWIDGVDPFDFRLPIHTLSFSGHKFLGSPMPCGVLISHRDRIASFKGCSQYVGSLDTTLSSSRNGISTLVLWLLIHKLGCDGMADLAKNAFVFAEETAEQMQRAGIPVSKHPNGCILVFPRPNDRIAKRWHLSTRGDLAHIVTLPGVSREMIQNFIFELTRE